MPDTPASRLPADVMARLNRFYSDLAVVDDVLEPEDDVLKVAVLDFGDVESGTAPAVTSRAAPDRRRPAALEQGVPWRRPGNAGLRTGLSRGRGAAPVWLDVKPGPGR